MKLNNSLKNLNFIYYNIPIVFARLFKFKRKEHKMKKVLLTIPILIILLSGCSNNDIYGSWEVVDNKKVNALYIINLKQLSKRK